jgi:hypothetical protein
MEQYNVIIHLNKVKNMKPIFKLLIAVFIPLAVGALSGYFTSSAISGWYATLNKPFFNPPNYLFGPVWTVLYIMMGIAYFLVWNSKLVSENKSKAYLFYWVQLFFNFMWSICFFYFQNPRISFGSDCIDDRYNCGYNVYIQKIFCNCSLVIGSIYLLGGFCDSIKFRIVAFELNLLCLN